jgi:hypothetical protein
LARTRCCCPTERFYKLKRSETQREFGPIPNRLNESKFGIAFW